MVINVHVQKHIVIGFIVNVIGWGDFAKIVTAKTVKISHQQIH